MFASCAAILRIGKKLGSYQVACADYTSRWMCYSPRNTFVRQSPHNIYSIFRMCLAQTPSGTSASHHWKCIHSRHWMTQRNMTKITSSISSAPAPFRTSSEFECGKIIRLLPYFPACPRVRYLNIEGSSSPDVHELASALSEMAPVFPLLEVVRCNRVSWGVLNCLSQLDALQQLWVDLPDQIDTSYCPTIETLTFPQLRALNMVTGTLQSSLEFLRLTALDKLTDLNMSCTYIAFDGAIYDASEDIQDLLALVPSQCRQLESIRVNSGVWPLACRRTSHSETSEFWLSRPATAPL